MAESLRLKPPKPAGSEKIDLSFVIPAHNEEKYIGHCLLSITKKLHTNSPDVEIIVVDNASTDRTGKIARQFPGVRIVEEPKKGIVLARRAGFLRAAGKLVANIDADTILPPGWIETVLREFQKDRRLVCLSGPFIYYDLSLWARILQRGFYGLAFSVYLINRFVLRVNSMVQGGNFVIKKAAFEGVGGFDVAIDFYGEDADVARRLNRVGRVKFTFRLPILASGRRLAREGILRTGFRYALNYLWVSLCGKPLTKTSTDVREAFARQ
jgi:cellulose synthase/poly-beta-1,6-N-acetylglucosamine synthase-like glycosyltransferase